jgi:hypothetical protein
MQPTIPAYVTPIILIVSLTLTVWLFRVIAEAASSAAITPVARSRFRVGTGIFLVAWLGLAFLAAPSTPVLDESGRGIVPATFLFFGGVSLAVAVGLLAFSSNWRRIVETVPAGRLIGTQVYRLIGGALFLPLLAIGTLPRHFALPAGWGDLAVGAMAPFVALAVQRGLRKGHTGSSGTRALALGWNLFGFLDLVVAVGMGTGWLVRLTQPELGAVSPAAAMTSFPLVLIPTYAVPLGFILHIYSIWRTVRNGQREPGQLGEIRGQQIKATNARV